MSPLQLSNSIIKNHSPRPKPAVPNKIITEDESSLPPACALSFAQNSTRRVKFVSWKPKKQSCWFPMGALGSFRKCPTSCQTKAAISPRVRGCLWASDSPPASGHGLPSRGSTYAQNLSNQIPGGGRGPRTGQWPRLHVLIFLPAYLPEAPALEASGQVIRPGLKTLSSPEILKLGPWASRQLKNWGPKRPSYDLCLSLFVLWDIKEKFKYYIKSFNNNKQPMTS